MTFRCDNCGDEVNGVVIVKPKWWEFSKKETQICQRCAYNKEFGTNLSVEQWNEKISSPPKTKVEKNTGYQIYEEFLHDMRSCWDREPVKLTHFSTLVKTYRAEKGSSVRILGIECPKDHLIAICGVEHSGVDPRDFAKAPHLYTIPHEFSILCYDEDNNELPPETIIRSVKIKPNERVVSLEPVLYGDLSLKIGGRFKRKEERYYFQRGIILYGGEWLYLDVVKLDMTIDRVELFMRCDIFTKVD